MSCSVPLMVKSKPKDGDKIMSCLLMSHLSGGLNEDFLMRVAGPHTQWLSANLL